MREWRKMASASGWQPDHPPSRPKTLWKSEGETLERLYAATRNRAWTWSSSVRKGGEFRRRVRVWQAQGVWEDWRAVDRQAGLQKRAEEEQRGQGRAEGGLGFGRVLKQWEQ